MSFKDLSFDNIKHSLEKQNRNYNVDLIERAYLFGEKAHEGQFRKSGERYFNHPVAVATTLIHLGMDTQTICAALLHDVVEDTDYTFADVKKEFGEDVAYLVESLTKLTNLPYVSQEEAQAENIRKMLLAMAEDIRVIIIKLADRLHNMRTIEGHPNDQKRREISRETLEIYAPIAHRLGIRRVKEELEDLAIHCLDPVAYATIEESLIERQVYREAYLKSIITQINDRLTELDVDHQVDGRVKSIHGIYRKMYMQGKSFDEIYDIYAVRVITNDVANCYNVLGIIHDIFRPLPNRFKDYISTPKPNMYQSLHTTVMPREGIPFEVQIRTWEMHKTAEFGIAAHWKYKEGVSAKDDKLEERLSWVRQLLETQTDNDNPEELVTTIKTDLTQDDVFAITPQGDIITLPMGSCVIDFAYAIHSAVGNKMIGAKVDGRIVPIDYKLKTGEVCEVLTSSQPHGPSRDWLSIVGTSEARNKIKAWFKKERRPENIAQGQEEITRELKRNNIRFEDSAQYEEFLLKIANKQHCSTIEDFYAAVGYGGIVLSKIMPRIKDDYRLLNKSTEIDIKELIKEPVYNQRNGGIMVDGMDDVLVKLSRCCNPLPGDRIIGYITRGHGVSVHKRDCNNVPRDMTQDPEADRWIAVKWISNENETFKSTIIIHCIDRPKILADLTIALANLHIALHSVNARETKEGNSEIMITISISSLEHLKNIINKLSKIQGVYTIERTNG